MTIVPASKASGPNGLGGERTDYTEAINSVEQKHGRIMNSGLFTPYYLDVTTGIIDDEVYELGIIPPTRRGAQASANKPSIRTEVPFSVPHFPMVDFIRPSAVQDRRNPGSKDPRKMANELAGRSQALSNKFDLTAEHLMMGAIKGNTVDANGVSLFNSFTAFDAGSQHTISYELDQAGTEVLQLTAQTRRYIENNINMPVPVERLHCYCGTAFFEALIIHPSIQEAYKYYQAHQSQLAALSAERTASQPAGQNPMQHSMRRGFLHDNILFEEYDATVRLPNGSTDSFIPADEAYCFPVGIPGLFRAYYAPADTIQHANTTAQEKYMFVDESLRSLRIDAEMNVLPLCVRPEVLVQLTRT